MELRKGRSELLYSYFMPVCRKVKTITPRCSGRPDALLHEAEGRVQKCTRSSMVPRGNSLTVLQTGMKKLFYYPTLLMKFLAAFVEWSCCRRCDFVTKHKISPNLLNFGLKMFRLFYLKPRLYAQFAPWCKFTPGCKIAPGSKFAPPYVAFICQ